jgi:hypothetical protein
MKCIPELSEVAASTKHPCFVSNLPQIWNPHQPILAGECQRWVYVLRLGYAEDSMFASIVNLDLLAVFDCQSSSAGENRILKLILCADCARRSEIHGPPNLNAASKLRGFGGPAQPAPTIGQCSWRVRLARSRMSPPQDSRAHPARCHLKRR